MKKQLIENADGSFKVLSSDGKKYYNTTISSCECIGFHTRGHCRHIELVSLQKKSSKSKIVFDKQVYTVNEFLDKFPDESLEELEKSGRIIINGDRVYAL